MELDRCRHIVVEGPIGAGKTSLARQLAGGSTPRRCSAAGGNPFLARFYEDGALRAAHPAQFPVPAQRPAARRRPARHVRRATVGDFLLDKDPLFARLNLSDAEYRLYDKDDAHLKPGTPTPDLVIYLQAPVDTLVERVNKRGVDYERAISRITSRGSPIRTADTYQYEEAPLLIVNSER